MHWLLLPVAALALVLALRTTSPGLMALGLVFTFAMIGAWLWLRYKLLFPDRDKGMQMTPLDRAELERLREQARINRENEAAARAAAEAEALHPIHPLSVDAPVMAAQAAPERAPNAPSLERPLTGRAVFATPDDDLPPMSAHGERPA